MAIVRMVWQKTASCFRKMDKVCGGHMYPLLQTMSSTIRPILIKEVETTIEIREAIGVVE
ncbi:Uncharacterised protein [Chlamydia trachomatis]|nr:Uncharacterised protein [Chlamydia trachomatis]